MSFLLGLLAARGVSALLGTLLLATRAGPGFAGPALTVHGDSVWLETELVRGFDRPLVQILESGSMVAVAYTVVVLTQGQDATVVDETLATDFLAAGTVSGLPRELDEALRRLRRSAGRT